MALLLNHEEPLATWIKKEIEFQQDIHLGAESEDVKRLQEWLTFSGFCVEVDRCFGRETEKSLRDYQLSKGLTVTGYLNEETHFALVDPIFSVLRPISPKGSSFAELCIQYAVQHWQYFPVDVNGSDRGPWVRLYAKGDEGIGCQWRSQFINFIINQAADTLGIYPPVNDSGVNLDDVFDSKPVGSFLVKAKLEKEKILRDGVSCDRLKKEKNANKKTNGSVFDNSHSLKTKDFNKAPSHFSNSKITPDLKSESIKRSNQDCPRLKSLSDTSKNPGYTKRTYFSNSFNFPPATDMITMKEVCSVMRSLQGEKNTKKKMPAFC